MTPGWQKVLAGRRTMLHYKPAAIAVLLDMLEAGEVQHGIVPFEVFERRFEALLKDFDLAGSKRAFFPFFRLSVGDGLWVFTKAGRAVVVPPPKASRNVLLKYADGARVTPDLLAFISSSHGRQTVRAALADLLAHDGLEKSHKLLAKLAPDVRVNPGANFAIDLEVGCLYQRQSQIHARFGGQSMSGISTPSGRNVILVFSGAGKKYGYKDGWTSDGYTAIPARARSVTCSSWAAIRRSGST